MAAPGNAYAGSCCGGGGGPALILPKLQSRMWDASAELEIYDGYWGRGGKWLPDPKGSHLSQSRLNAGYARRLADNWQTSVILPLIYNDNQYQSQSSATHGLGDITAGIMYEAFDTAMCVWSVETWRDLAPAPYFGLTLTIPTGVSPFDDAQRSWDVTGRGFYRLDAVAVVEKTVWPWTLTLSYSYGVHMERPVNREYGDWVEPYHKKLGDRRLYSITGAYTRFMSTDDSLTFALGYSDLWEGAAMAGAYPDPGSGFRKSALSANISFSNVDKSFIARIGWNRAMKGNGWGENFPVTDILSLGVSYAY